MKRLSKPVHNLLARSRNLLGRRRPAESKTDSRRDEHDFEYDYDDEPASEYDSDLEDSGTRFSNGYTPAAPTYSPKRYFEHNPLPEGRWMRLVRLLPGVGKEPIVVEISQCRLDDAPPYEAISYVWGDREDTQQITCDGCSLKVPTNLFLALRRFRRGSGSRTLWADSICINQSDTIEKGHQVDFMAQIFGRAETVLGWLGSDRPRIANDVFNFMRVCCEDAHLQLEEMQGTITKNLHKVTPLTTDQFATTLEDISRIRQSEYFHRIWVVQEIGLAKSLRIYRGTHSIDFCTFMEFYYIISQSFHPFYDGNLDLGITSVLLLVWMTYPGVNSQTWISKGKCLKAIREFYEESRRDLEFSQILDICRGRYSASDHRDFVFGLLGHPSASIGGEAIMQADYSSTVQDVYESLAKASITKSKSLRLLHTVSHRGTRHITNNTTKTSWIPEWNTPRDGRHLNDRLWIRDEILQAESKTSFKASVNSDLHLRCEGLILDIITFRSPFELKKNTQTEADNENSLKGSWIQLISQRNASTRDVVSLFVAHGKYKWAHVELQFFLDAFAFASQIPLPRLKKEMVTLKHGLEPQLRDLGSSMKGVPSNVPRRALRNMHRKHYFMTSQGYLGIGCRLLEPGDICCTMFGADAMFILRPVEGREAYHLIGTCCIAGLMEGKVGEMYRSRDLTKQDIVII